MKETFQDSPCCQSQTVTLNAAFMVICITDKCLLILATLFLHWYFFILLEFYENMFK